MKIANKPRMKVYRDYSTKNISFLKMTKILTKLGVKNNDFFLALRDTDLIGVDPFDPFLTDDMKTKIVHECFTNKFYYFRECLRVSQKGSNTPVRYQLHLGNLSIHFLRWMNLNSYLELPRQCGKSIGAAAEFGYDFLFAENSEMGVFNYNNDMVKTNIERITQMLDLLPHFMRWHTLEKVADKDNPDLVDFKIKPKSNARKMSATMDMRGNLIKGKTPGINKSQADEAGRGATMLHQWWDEPCAIRNFDIAVGAAFPSYVTASREARKNGASYSIMITSTPPDIDSEQGKFLLHFVKMQMKTWSVLFFDKSRAELENILDKDSKNGFFYCTFQYFMVGKDMGWYQEQLKSLAGQEDVIRREILLIWDKSIVDNPYSIEDLNALERTIRNFGNFVEIEILPALFFKVFCNKQPDGPGSFKQTMKYIRTKRILLASDVSGGRGGDRDFSTIVGVDPITSDLLFTFSSNILNPREFYELYLYFVKNYCPKAMVVVERNNVGAGVLASLMDPNPERGIPKNLVYFPVSNSSKQAMNLRYDTDDGRMAGIYTIKTIRDELFNDILNDRILNHKYIFRSEEIFNQVCSLTERNGRIDHKLGAHDDLLFAYMIAMYVLTKHYKLLRVDFPDMGVKKVQTDVAIDEYSYNHSVNLDSVGLDLILSDFRYFYDDLVNTETDYFDTRELQMNTIDKAIEARMAVDEFYRDGMNRKLDLADLMGGHDDGIDTGNPFNPENIMRQVHYMNNDINKMKAENLGISSEEYNSMRQSNVIDKGYNYQELDQYGLPKFQQNNQVNTADKNRLLNMMGKTW